MRSAEDAVFRKRFGGGRSLFARALDYFAIRAVLLIAAFLYFRALVESERIAAALSLIALAAAMVGMRIVREARYARFLLRERASIRRAIFLERLIFMPEDELLSLVEPLSSGRPVVVLRHAEAAGPDALYPALRLYEGPFALFATGGYADGARAFQRRCRPDVVLLEPDAVAAAAENSKAYPTDEDVSERIRAERESQREQRRGRVSRAFARGTAKKYALCACVLFAASFFSGYTIYYRVLASLCALFSALAFFASSGNTQHAAEA